MFAILATQVLVATSYVQVVLMLLASTISVFVDLKDGEEIFVMYLVSFSLSQQTVKSKWFV